MKIRMLSCVAVGVVALLVSPCPAQESIKEQPKEKPADTSALPVLPADGCDKGCPVPKILWVEKDVPIQRLEPREVITEIKRPTVKVEYRDEKRVITDTVFKPREVLREVPCTVLKPVTVTDSCTGHCTTTLEPCTEMKLVKETVFVPVCEERTVTVKVPFLKETEEIVKQKTILLELKTVLQKREYPVAVPGGEVPKDRWLAAPLPCPCPHHP